MDRAFLYASFLTLEYATCLAQERNFSKAARALFITQSALSQHILGLEKKLRVQLFDRSRTPLALTPEGKFFIEGASSILQARDALWRTMSDFADFRRGELVLGTTPVGSLFILPKILPLFTDRYPDFQLVAKEAVSSELENMVLNDSLDLAIFPFIHKRPELAYKELYTEKVRLYVPKGYAPPNSGSLEAVLRDISPMALILMHPGTKFGSRAREMLKSVPELPRIMEVGNYIIALSLVAKGIGVTLAPGGFFGCQEYGEDVVALPLELEGGTRKIVVAHRKKRKLSRAAHDMIDIIRKTAAGGD